MAESPWRAALLRWVLDGTDSVVAYQRFWGVTPQGPTNRVAHAIFSAGSALGNELFFITFLPLLFWLFDVNIARIICQQWVICFYVGQYWKDTTKLPRPPADKVVRLERHYEHEYGLPSTHASNAICMPWYIVWLAWDRFEWAPKWVLLLLAAYWTITCIASRPYMGVHSPADLVAGSLLGVSLLAYSIRYGATVDHWLQTSPAAWWAMPLAALILSAIYPRPKRPYWLNSPGDTTLILGSGLGISLASKALAVPQAASLSKPITGPGGLEQLVAMLPGLCLGLVLLLGVKSVCKAACLAVARLVVAPAYGPADDPSINPAYEPPSHGPPRGKAGKGGKDASATPTIDTGIVNSADASPSPSPPSLAPQPSPVPSLPLALSAHESSASRSSLGSASSSSLSSSSLASQSDPSAVSTPTSAGSNGSGRDPVPPSPSPTNASAPVAQAAGVQKVPSEGLFPRSASGDEDSANASGVRRRKHDATDISSKRPAPTPAAATAGSSTSSPSADASASGDSSSLKGDAPGSASASGLVEVPLIRRYDVELPTKLVTYTAVGFSAVYLIPIMLQRMGVADYGY